MAKIEFFVGREGQTSVKCSATLPKMDDLLEYPGGKIVVETPKGKQSVDLPPTKDLLVKQIAIILQHGVRDFLFPLPPTAKNGKKTKGTKYTD